MHNKALNALAQRCLKVVQAEDSAITYTVKWGAFLGSGTVSTSTWTTEDNGLTIANAALSDNDASARLSGDVGRYRAINTITTSSGDTYQRFVDVTIKDNSGGYAFDYGLVLD